jgi:DhnA family fructose-bisphosphate aldolase class Ia
MSIQNWETGRSLRQSRLFDSENNRSVIVAMDHSFGGSHKGLEDPGLTLEKVLNGNPTGVIITPGTCRTFQSRFAGQDSPAMIVSIDYVLFHSYPTDDRKIEEQGIVSSVQQALKFGADAIKILMIHGRHDPSIQVRNFDLVGQLVETAHQWGMPVIVEPTTWGHRFTKEKTNDVIVLRDMARIAFEFGADVVKIDVPEDPAEFGQIAESCPVPLLILGGTKKPSLEILLRDVVTVIKNGANGVTFGRNIWQHENPEKIIKALKLAVFDEDISEALRVLEE